MSCILRLTILIFLVGCATKLRVPLNRMQTPETVGGAMSPELELTQIQQAQASVDVGSSEPYSLDFSTNRATGYYMALSFLESLDLSWSHSSSAPSMIGLKWQFLGNSSKQAGAGHSLALTGAMGGNEHEIEDDVNIDFTLSATDFALIHGYWVMPMWQVYDSFSYSRYSLSGDLSGDETGDFNDKGTHYTLALGTALVFRPYRVKLEWANTKSQWSNSGSKSFSSLGFSFGAFF